MANKKIKISVDNEVTQDEVFCSWFQCTNCDSKDIASYANFCDNCGVEIEWFDSLQDWKDEIMKQFKGEYYDIRIGCNTDRVFLHLDENTEIIIGVCESINGVYGFTPSEVGISHGFSRINKTNIIEEEQ